MTTKSLQLSVESWKKLKYISTKNETPMKEILEICIDNLWKEMQRGEDKDHPHRFPFAG